VICQLDTLRRCMPSSIRKVLNELPTTLDDTYERALEGIPKEKRQHAHHLFQCLVGAIRPLRAEELAEIFAIDFDRDAMSNFMDGWRPENAEEAVLSTCSTLISVVEDKGSKIVQFSHFSVKEFLTSDRLRTSEVGDIRHYHVSLDAAHTILVRACLAVLLQLDEHVDGKRSRWLCILLSTGSTMLSTMMWHREFKTPWKSSSTQASPTLQHGFGYGMQWGGGMSRTSQNTCRDPRQLRYTMRRSMGSVGWSTTSL